MVWSTKRYPESDSWREGGAEEGNGGPDGIVHGTGMSVSQNQDALFVDRVRGVCMWSNGDQCN